MYCHFRRFWNNYYFFDPAIAVELRGMLPIAPFPSLAAGSTFCRPFFIDIMVLHNYKHPTTSQNRRFRGFKRNLNSI